MLKRVTAFALTIVMALGLSGCGSSDSSSSKVDKSQKEAPMLAEKVKAGSLPSLKDRLPSGKDAMVEPDVKELGQYGGSITLSTNDDGRWGWGPWTEEGMFRFKQDGSGKVEANVAKNFSSNEDNTVWTIELREGMKWSDGQPFTADDVLFYYNHMSTPALNPDRTALATNDPKYYNAYTTKPYNCYQVKVDGKSYWSEFKKVNDYKFTVTFKAPKPTFPQDVATDNKWMFIPEHFYKDFVARQDGVTNDAKFPAITKAQALANANKMFSKNWDSYEKMGKDIGYYNWDYYQIPQIRSFIATKNNWNKVGETYELVRNPYFFKTDKEGRQLPYLDSLKFSIINDNEQVVLKATAGQIDVYSVQSLKDFSTVAAGTKSTHDVYNYSDVKWANSAFMLNQTVKDADKRKLFQDKNFRQALSIAVDRNLMNGTVANGRLTPQQASLPKGFLQYNADWSNKWTEFSVDKANQLLDTLTEPWDKKPDTYRKIKGTNKELDIIVSLQSSQKDLMSNDFAIMKTAFKAVGVKVSDKIDDDVTKTILGNNHEATFEDIGATTPAIRPDTMIPMRNYRGWYGAYGKWYEDGKSEKNGGIAPTGDVLELVKAYDNIKAAVGKDRDKTVQENVQKIYDLHKENVWVIGYLSAPPNRIIANKKVKNLPQTLIMADEYRFMNLARPEQLYIAK